MVTFILMLNHTYLYFTVYYELHLKKLVGMQSCQMANFN